MRIRQMVSLKSNPTDPDPTLLWYSRAIGVMRTQRKFSDPTSWRFQGAIHDYDKDTDPYQNPADPAPKGSIQRKYWRQCQHSSWFFLPWHRMYLYHFEQMIAAAVVQAGGPRDWALPYWDYTDSLKARKLPAYFRKPRWKGGETNYLYVAKRAPGINAGTVALDTKDVETATALAKRRFSTAATSSDVEFGGPRAKNHDGGAYPFGGIESSPHNHVHVAVGGPKGFMYDPTQAALDPIFWLHHANIDRLWELWLRQPGRVNPTLKTWLASVKFPFFNVRKRPVTMTASQVVDPTKLGYEYDGLPPPAEALAVAQRKFVKRARRTTMVGATAKAFALHNVDKAVSITTPTLRAEHEALLKGPSEEEPRVLLHLENLEGGDVAGSYDVYVNLPTGAEAVEHPDRLAGRISLFGAKAAKRRSRSHARSGFSFVLDVSDIYARLAEAEGWRAKKVSVTLRPVYDWSDAVKVGRISVNVR